MRDRKTGQFVRKNIDKSWLYQKYVVERLPWNDFYCFGISLKLLQSRLKEFGITRPRIAWNKGLNKLIDKRINYNRPTLFKSQGKCELKEIIRHNFRYRKWRSDIFIRDDFTCQICGKKGGKIQADHIKPFSIIIEENNIKTLKQALECEKLWNIYNGRTLCMECHKETDTYLLGTKYKNFGVSNLAFAVPA